MKALVFEDTRKLALTERPEPTPGTGEVKLKIKACGICGSDVAGYLGLSGRRTPPLVMGHEFAGEIVEVGAGVSGFAVGDRVAVQPKPFCGRCGFCSEDLTNECTEGIPLMGCLTTDGAFQEYLNVPSYLLYRIPQSMSYESAAMIEPFAVAYSGVLKAGPLDGKDVLIIGAGTIGMMALSIASKLNPRSTIVVDLSEKRLLAAKAAGATHTVNAKTGAISDAVQQLIGKLADAALEAVGVGETVRQAIGAVSTEGVCVLIGLNQRSAELDLHELVTRELTVRGSYLYSHKAFGEAMDFIIKHNIELGRMVKKSITLDEAPAMFEELAGGADKYLKVLVVFK